MNKAPIILLVEDEAAVLRINQRLLKRRGYQVRCAESCAQAREQLEQETPDLLILDIMLPDGSGYDLCRAFRADHDHPVIFLSGKSAVGDKIDGLALGGDYYLTKPYDPDELLAVVERLLQRHQASQEKEAHLTTLRQGSLTLFIPQARAEVQGRDAQLTAKEFALLLLLVRRREETLSPDALYAQVWGASPGSDTRTVRFHITNLRKKLDADNALDFDIISVYGKGYRFTTIR